MDLGGNERYFYLIKIIRLFNGFKIFSVPALMMKMKVINNKIIDKMIKNDKEKAEDTLEDNNNISSLILFNFFMSTFKLAIIILNISYFMGIGWYIYVDLIRKYKEWQLDNQQVNAASNYNKEFFLETFELSSRDPAFVNKSNAYLAITCTYYAFTSLSTVGFGDYNPRSDEERAVCAFILLFGVAIFSYMMGIFIDMLGTRDALYATLDDGDNLTRFFGMMNHFNNNRDINTDLMKRIENHFDYKWNNDKNQAYYTEDDQAMLDQLPDEV